MLRFYSLSGVCMVHFEKPWSKLKFYEPHRWFVYSGEGLWRTSYREEWCITFWLQHSWRIQFRFLLLPRQVALPKLESLICPTILHLAVVRRDEYIPFLVIFLWKQTQTASSSIWTWFTESIMPPIQIQISKFTLCGPLCYSPCKTLFIQRGL